MSSISGCLEKNLKTLRDLGFELYQNPEEHPPEGPEELWLVPTPSGITSVKYRGVLLHSQYDPKKEAERLLEKEFPGGKPGLCVFQGLGLGYQVEVFLETVPEGKALILEPDLGLFAKLIKVHDFSHLFSDPRVTLHIGTPPQFISKHLSPNYYGEVRIFKLRGLYGKDQEYYQEADKIIQSYLSRREINTNTLKRFGRLWVRNLTRNTPLLTLARPVAELFGGFKGVPAAVCAGGPSLDVFLSQAEKIRERCLIIAVDTALKGLLSRGIKPDIILVVDPQYWNTRHLDGCPVHGSLLVSESSTHPRIFRFLSGGNEISGLKELKSLFFCASLFPLGQRIEKELGSFGRLGAGGSVATSAWDLARLLGCGPIFIAGLDLGFPGKETHYRGSFFEERSHSLSYRKSPTETHSCASLWNADPFYEKNNSGGTTLTDRRLFLYKSWFEAQFRDFPDTDTLSLSPEGIAISGLPPGTMDDILRLPVIRQKLDISLDGILSSGSKGKKYSPDSKKQLKDFLQSLILELARSDLLAGKGLDLLDFVEKNRHDKDVRPVLNLLDEIDKEMLTSGSLDIAGFLIHEISAEILSGKNAAENILEQNKKIYMGIRDSAGFHEKLLQRAIKELDEI